MWANKEGEREIGKWLFHFVCWMIIQSFVIIILESLHLLPGDLIDLEIEYHDTHLGIDRYTIACGFVGTIYTAIGCVIITLHEVNSPGWWRHYFGWYLAYLPLSFLLFYYEIGWRVVDVWFAPVLWVGEIELVYYIQNKIRIKELKEIN